MSFLHLLSSINNESLQTSCEFANKISLICLFNKHTKKRKKSMASIYFSITADLMKKKENLIVHKINQNESLHSAKHINEDNIFVQFYSVRNVNSARFSFLGKRLRTIQDARNLLSLKKNDETIIFPSYLELFDRNSRNVQSPANYLYVLLVRSSREY